VRIQAQGESRVSLSTQLEEIPQEVVAGGGEDRLGVKLHTFDVMLFVSEAHNQAVRRLRCDFKLVGHGIPIDDERVIPRRLERIGQACEDAHILMIDH